MKYLLKTSTPAAPQYNLDKDLNSQQRAAATASPGKLLIIAGAGTGKTRTLTYRMAELVRRGCLPERVLLCTFTNRAAREMVGRVESLLGIDMRRCTAGTFHHIGNRILRRFGEHVGLRPDFGILDGEDCKTVLASVIAEQGLQVLSKRRFPQPKLLQGLLGFSRGTLRPLREIIMERATHLEPQIPAILETVDRYTLRKREMNVCDYDDLVGLWHQMLVDPKLPELSRSLPEAFDHVLVDEYQDVSTLQGALCDRMAENCGSLTAVGDDAQSIYAFRGASFEQIFKFSERHDNARTFPLTVNYRSTPQILHLANRSIEHNSFQHNKELNAVSKDGMHPALIPLRNVYQQAEFVAQRALELHHDQGIPLRSIGVLYRNHAHCLELQVELTRRQIPFTINSGLRLFEQAHIKDVVAYLRAKDNHRDELAWFRLLRLWPGIGSQTAENLSRKLSDAHNDSMDRVLAVLKEQETSARQPSRRSIETLRALWQRLHERDFESPGASIREIVDAHYAEYSERAFRNATDRKNDLKHLAGYADRYSSTTDFLAELALVQGMQAEHIVGSEPKDDRLSLSSVHQAKGLEWDVCLVLWLAQGRFPIGPSPAQARGTGGRASPLLRRGHASEVRALSSLPSGGRIRRHALSECYDPVSFFLKLITHRPCSTAGRWSRSRQRLKKQTSAPTQWVGRSPFRSPGNNGRNHTVQPKGRTA